MNKNKIVVLGSVVLWTMSGCGGSGSSSPSPTGSPSSSPMTTPSPSSPSPTPTPIPSPQPGPTAEPLPIVDDLPPYEPIVLVEDIVEAQIAARQIESTNSICTNGSPSQNMFADVSLAAGINHQYFSPESDGIFGQAGGVAAGDVDNDGWVDFYLVSGPDTPSALFRNLGDGTFENVASGYGVDFMEANSGPAFADFDGDGWLDLFIGALGPIS